MLLILMIVAAETLSQPPAPGFVIGYQFAKNGSSIVEQVPSGENVDNWTRMLTTQRFAGVAQRTDANGYVQSVLSGLTAACPGAKVLYRRNIGSALQVRVDCPLNPKTGQPETFFLKAMPGAADMHVSQVAFRSVPTAADVAWTEKYLAAVKLTR